MPTVDFIVGNTYNKLPRSDAKLDRTGQHLKIHDWTLFVDVVNGGDADIIDGVSFDLGPSFSPRTYICPSPISIKQSDGSTSWRFKTRQQTYGATSATIRIRGAGGTMQEIKHNIQLSTSTSTSSSTGTRSNNMNSPVKQFVENLDFRAKKPLKMDKNQNFGIELELTSANTVSEDDAAGMMSSNSAVVEVIRNYREGRVTSSNWKIVPDSSIMCSETLPDCNKFELVSPILTGGTGLSKVCKILKQVQHMHPKLEVNKSMGFHLHIDIETYTHGQLVKICQNFIKYESVIDTFMPKSRRSGSHQSDEYFQSNRQSVADQVAAKQGLGRGATITNRMCHRALQMTERNDELVKLMNDHGRYYKLNLENIITGRQPTIEFRQHSATTSYDKVSHWVRFCVAFCNNSAKLGPPTPFSENRGVDFKFDALFQYVIKDRVLRDYYQVRREHIAKHDNAGDGSCCSGCAGDAPCTIKRRRRGHSV